MADVFYTRFLSKILFCLILGIWIMLGRLNVVHSVISLIQSIGIQPGKNRLRRLKKLCADTTGRVSTLSDEEHATRIKVLDVHVKPGPPLPVASVDLHNAINRKKHHTKEYDQPGLILRRGEEFALTISFNRKINTARDRLAVQLTYGSQPKESKGTIVRVPVEWAKNKKNSDLTECWEVCTQEKDEKSVTLTLKSPSDACIGKYGLFVETKLKDEDEVKRYKHDEEIIILFNPWCEEDTVYMKDPTWRKEYVLNESGNVWVGSWYRQRPWNFGQFTEPCLDAALYLLDKGELADTGRNSPISVVRIISALANSNDDDGVLEGRWTETYPKNSTAPWKWTGSVKILEEFMETGKPVQYGQCWVFSCLTTTLLRALGIPTRSVTNFESAHDTDCSMTIDFHYDEEGEPLSYLNDSKWNFHVWNESWFRRPDLPDGYDGWQALDATPQELSEGVMRCGPAPLKAIKEGHVYLNYDVPFIFSEVNGDKVNWRVQADGSMSVIGINKGVVGKKISTKAIGTSNREDLTEQYKYPEGSTEERRVVKFVNKFAPKRKQKIYNLDTKQEVDINADLPVDTMIGDDLEIKVKVTNKMNAERKVSVRMTLVSVYYTGVEGQRVKSEKVECVLPADKAKTITMKVAGSEYEEKRNPEGSFQIFINAKNLSNGRMHVVTEVFTLATPPLTVELPPTVTYDKDTNGKVTFKNTTRLTLTNGVLSCDGAGLVPGGFSIPIKKSVKPGETITQNITLHPKKKYQKRRQLDVTFNCDQIVSVVGTSGLTKIVNAPVDDDSSDED